MQNIYKTRRSIGRILGALAAIGFSSLMSTKASSAGDLITGATITQVVVRNTTPSNNNDAREAFHLATTGGSGPCAGIAIKFPSSGSASVDDGMRSVAIAAYLSGKPIRVYDYDGAGGVIDCDGADYIRAE
jgi:hypothetical protein